MATASLSESGRDLFSGLDRNEFVIQTKWFVVPSPTNILSPKHAPAKMLRESLDRMRLDYIDIYLVHGHIRPSPLLKPPKALLNASRAV